ncbi:MAG: Rrf2 family transcriptional regulator [Firmicutes bacterium]|nr:Rrf2 family transcriptional regulator [Bacillota bacterium]
MQLIIQSGDLGPSWFHVALRVLVLLSKSHDNLLKSTYLAQKLGADPTFVRKILVRLSNGGLVFSHSGRYGGYNMSKPAADITVGEVYRTMIKTQTINPFSVPQTGSEQIISLIISKAETQFQDTLDTFTIEDLLENS